MTASNITFQTTVLNGVCLSVTSGFGIILHMIVFGVIFSPVMKWSVESSTITASASASATEKIFVSSGINDCMSMICWIVAAIRASIKEINVNVTYSDVAAYVSTACRICKRYHLLLLILSRFLALHYHGHEYEWESPRKLNVILTLTWALSYAATIPILAQPRVDYAIRDFTFHIRNIQARKYFFIEEIFLVAVITAVTIYIFVWMIKEYIKYRNVNLESDGTIFVVTRTTEMTRFIREMRKTFTALIMIGLYFVSAICSWIWSKDDGGDVSKRDDDTYLTRYIFGVYIWCLNCAAPPTIFIIVEEIVQKILAKILGKKNVITPIINDTESLGHTSERMHVDADRATPIIVFPMADLSERPSTSETIKIIGSGNSSPI